ncbi:MAG TPA: zonular occludens toxin domain-containing protein [Noviherbaspirillum sp.]|jgi:zona occludens toxin|uniref:zonular occludens toxin domain-containing protein n=1 Tax=Noviherbaspirillum sp. TaxID=1926288 RepID=UPI002F9221EC
MITLITGLPGACKTLWTLSYVKALAEKEGRQVFYSGIKDLMLPWTEIDAAKWFDCPNGSIIVLDECQTLFRPRSFGSNVPEYVAKLETHRHQGLDLFIITQHPQLVDTNVRRLVGRHMHAVRKFGMAAATLHEWNAVVENCGKPSGRADSIKHHWKYDKKAYSYYKSAEVHTVKRNIPFRVIVLFVILPIAIGVLGWRFYGSVKDRTSAASAPAPGVPGGASPAFGGLQRGAGYQNPMEDARQYAFENTARVDGLPHTAPKYDAMTKPEHVPVPAACVHSGSRCQCYTQQATKLQVPHNLCLDIAHNGYFQEFEANRDRAHQSAQYLSRQDRLPISGAESRDRSPVAVMGDENGYGVLGRRGRGGAL